MFRQFSFATAAASALFVSMTISGCSDGEDIKPEDTVIGTQVEALNEAKKVEKLLIDTSRARADSADENQD